MKKETKELRVKREVINNNDIKKETPPKLIKDFEKDKIIVY